MTAFDLITEDNVTLRAIANDPPSTKIGMLCFHMMPATKESYNHLLETIQDQNILAWAIDFRGHGESTNGNKLNYRNFSDKEHQNYRLDAQTAYRAMKEKVTPSIVIGASIGANIALQLQAEFAIPKSILLSPARDYRGVATVPSAQKLTSQQSSLIITSNEQYQSGESAKKEAEALFEVIASPAKKIKTYPNSAHGTNILETDPSAFQDVLNFIIA